MVGIVVKMAVLFLAVPVLLTCFGTDFVSDWAGIIAIGCVLLSFDIVGDYLNRFYHDGE